MWNTFYSCKDAIKSHWNFNNRNAGLTPEEFTPNAKEIIDRNIQISVSKAKSELIAYILENAAVDIMPDELFVCRINHGTISNHFKSRHEWIIHDRFVTKETETLENANAIRAYTDFGHIAPDWQYLLDNGIGGITDELERLRKKHISDHEKKAYYDERIRVYRAISRCFTRFAELAENIGTEKTDFIAQNLRHLSVGAPATYAQALQLILLFYVIQTNLDIVIIRSLGGLDRMLFPFYKNDLANGTYTKSQIAEMTNFFLWEIGCMQITANMPFYICGMASDGNDATNELTLHILNQYRELGIYDPKIHVLYHEKMNRQVLMLILEMIREGKNSFVFINTALASKALENIGVSADDAKRVIVYGCYETAAEGTEIPCTCGGMINLAKAIEFAVYGGKDYNGNLVSLKTADDFDSFEEFFETVLKHLEYYTTVCMDSIARYEAHCDKICPSLIMSPTFKSSRETGIDLYSGGAKYNNTSVVGAGIATLVDSLVAVKHIVFEEKLKNFDELRQILLSNWTDDPKLRLSVKKKYPKYGNNTEEADRIAVDIYNRFADTINGRKNGRGGVFRCGMFSVDWRFWMGEKTGATPDGRCTGEPLSKNIAAAIGQDKNGVIAYLQSVLKYDGKKCPDGYVADVVLHQSAVKGDDGMQAFLGLLKTFMQEGGFSVHFNILSPDMLINAQKEPEKYRNLQIRLCGWNVRFVDLDKAQQDEFIKQSVNAM